MPELGRLLPGATWLGLVLLFAACVMPAAARDIEVRALSSRVEAGRFLIDATLDVRLTPNTREALDNGVTLQFVLETSLLKPRRLWWDDELTNETRRFLLSRHALADGYLLSEAGSDRQQTYKRLEDALQALGSFEGYDAGEVDDARPPRQYRGRLRLRLDIEALPAPLRPIAYVSPSWRVSSGWYEWSFAR
ncbi:MAG TPA: DUF4390 domain-containing protein [Gammaproteobacteria bacterium]|nr:DUF4390 domain-containing protein [Gammaproteobacteria bacterium]